jgi:hypothetical protein
VLFNFYETAWKFFHNLYHINLSVYLVKVLNWYNLFSEPNNDSPMNPQAAVLWPDKVEMRQRVLFEHKKSESQWNWQMTSELKTTWSVTSYVLKLSPVYLTLSTSVFSFCTVTSHEYTASNWEPHRYLMLIWYYFHRFLKLFIFTFGKCL